MKAWQIALSDGQIVVVRRVLPSDALPFGEADDWRAVYIGKAPAPDVADGESWRKVRATWPIGAVVLTQLGRPGLLNLDEFSWDRPTGVVI